MSDTTDTQETAPAGVQKHTLLRAHKHGGQWHAKGAKLPLTDAQAKRLRNEQKIK